MATTKVCASPSRASAVDVRVRCTMLWGLKNSTSRTDGPASRSSVGASFGPTPFSEDDGAKSGKRISGRIYFCSIVQVRPDGLEAGNGATLLPLGGEGGPEGVG